MRKGVRGGSKVGTGGEEGVAKRRKGNEIDRHHLIKLVVVVAVVVVVVGINRRDRHHLTTLVALTR